MGASKASAKAALKASKVRSKKVKRGDREFQDLVDEMMVDLVNQDMEAAAEEARRKAEQEHEASAQQAATHECHAPLCTTPRGISTC